MKLSERKIKELIDKLSELFNQAGGCAVCKGREWQLADRIYTYREFEPAPGNVSYIPVVVTFCKQCGVVRTFNVFSLGLFDPNTGGVIDV